MSQAVTFFRGKDNSDFTAENSLFEKYPVVRMEQLHGVQVVEVTAPDSATITGADAIYTKLPNVWLTIKSADCVPILISHPSGAIAAIHAGRKSTQQGILAKTLNQMKDAYNLDDTFEIWLGPSICRDCYQVNRDTNEHFDLIEENIKQAQSVCAVDKIKIVNAGHCTAHENANYYSYRKEGPGVKMNYAGIRL